MEKSPPLHVLEESSSSQQPIRFHQSCSLEQLCFSSDSCLLLISSFIHLFDLRTFFNSFSFTALNFIILHRDDTTDKTLRGLAESLCCRGQRGRRLHLPPTRGTQGVWGPRWWGRRQWGTCHRGRQVAEPTRPVSVAKVAFCLTQGQPPSWGRVKGF